VEIFGNIAFEDLVAGLTQMDLVAPEKRYDRLMVGTKQIGKDVDVIGVRLGLKKVTYQLIETLDVLNVFESSRAWLDGNERDR
jgi:hypothetical protein